MRGNHDGLAGRYRGALRHRDLRLMLTAFLIDQIGSWAYNVVLIVYAYERTGSPAWIAAATAAGWVPRILCSAYAGVLADHFERTRLLLISALAGLLLMLGLTVLVATGGPLPAVLAVAAAAAAVGTVYLPVSGALVPEMVPESDLAAANGLLGILENLVVIVGPALGAALLLTGKPVTGIVINAATFAVAAILVGRLHVRSRGTAGQAGQRLTAQLAAGAAALRRDAVARTLVAFCALGTAVYGASTVLYIPMSGRFGTGPDGYGYLLAAAAAGGVLGACAATRLSESRRLPLVVLGGILALALPFAATVLVSSPALGAALQVVSGAGMVVVDVVTVTALQRSLPRDLLGRVLGILETVVLAAALAASFAVAALIRMAGLNSTLLIVGFGFAAAALAGLPVLTRAVRPVTPVVPAALAAAPAVLAGTEAEVVSPPAVLAAVG
jgi:Transmembrane secretion effector